MQHKFPRMKDTERDNKNIFQRDGVECEIVSVLGRVFETPKTMAISETGEMNANTSTLSTVFFFSSSASDHMIEHRS
jgi:hypothetical protein